MTLYATIPRWSISSASFACSKEEVIEKMQTISREEGWNIIAAKPLRDGSTKLILERRVL